ncbi:MAG TPA: UDP-glucose/GDP-mannose dehydrogenase family protein [Planctomycetes bacterium]|nr:UDP-glucose/GDP-mannose dehydrogenase family protein [Planctomycetota bacterium]HIN79928.1 UDP-glucose/GDP-mannose dehydrogenase family protein [Planctomycetota bacterium]
MKITVIGTGYVGLVTGTCLADGGHDLICVDQDPGKIDKLTAGEIPIYEPGLKDLVQRNSSRGRLSFSTDLKTSLDGREFAFIAVGTPQAEDGSCDLSQVLKVAQQIGEAMTGPLVVVNKSTVPVGTARRITEIITGVTRFPVTTVSNPEFLKEGAAIDDFMKPDRIVLGVDDPKVAEKMRELYAPFLRTGKPILVMDPASAEMTKYVSNALLATKISFINEIARLCDKVGADVSQVRIGVGSDSRIGSKFLFPGVGYGGSCFPKDVRAISRMARENGISLQILEMVDLVNEQQKNILVEKVVARFGEDLTGKTLALWGLAFKPRTNDMREAPSINIVEGLIERGARIRAHDPEAIETAREIFEDRIEFSEAPYDALTGANALLLVTEWNEFRRPDFPRMRKALLEPIIFDGRNIYSPDSMRAEGFEYYGMGTGGVVDE